MQSDSPERPSQQPASFFHFLHSNRIYLGLASSVLFSIIVWNHLPEFTSSNLLGKLILSVGICILFMVAAYRIKWSAPVALVCTAAYLVFLPFQQTDLPSYTESEPQPQTEEISYTEVRNN